MSYLNFASEIVAKARTKGADECDVILFENNSTSVDIRLGKLENIERSSSRALGIRVFIGKKSAIISSNSFAKQDIDNSIDKLLDMAKFSTEDEYTGLVDEKYYPVNDIDLEQYDEFEPSIEWMKNQAIETENYAMKYDLITNSEGSNINYSKNLATICNSRGFAKESRSSDCGISISVIAGKNDEMERDYEFSSKIFFSDLDSPENIGEKAAKRTIAKLNSRKIKTAEMPVIFEPRIASSLISCFVKAINGASIARNTSFLKDKLGKRIFPENINIIDDPLMKKGLGSRYFDAESVATKKMNLVENGILKTWLLDLRSANKLNMKLTGHASRSISSSPRPSASNVYLDNSIYSEDELIDSVKNGVYITELFGMGVNLITGDYSQGAVGFMIENGKISYPISEFTIASNLNDMFQNMSIANNLIFKTTINSPSIKIEKMMVAGS